MLSHVELQTRKKAKTVRHFSLSLNHHLLYYLEETPQWPSKCIVYLDTKEMSFEPITRFHFDVNTLCAKQLQ